MFRLEVSLRKILGLFCFSLIFVKMAISKSPLTNYFKKRNIADYVEEVNEVEIQSNSIDKTEVVHTKQHKPNELSDSTDDTTAASIISSTTASSIQSSSNKRDPCHGPAKAKNHILLGTFQLKTKFPTVNSRRFRVE